MLRISESPSFQLLANSNPPHIVQFAGLCYTETIISNRNEDFSMARPVFDRSDYEKNHLAGALGYVVFFVPLIVNSKSRFCRFCANQGALAWIVYAAVALIFGILNFLIGWLPLIGWLIRLAGSLIRLALLALMVYYGWNAYNGKAEPLPFIGGIELFR